MIRNTAFRPVMAALGAMLFWSLSFVWVKIAYEAYEPLSVILLRLIISSVLLFTFSLAIRRLQLPQRKDAGIFILLALFEPFLYFMGESFGLKYVSSTIAAVIVATIPLFAPFFAWFFFKERLTAMNIAGLIASFIGVTIVVINPDFTLSASPKGILLVFGAVISAIAYSVVLRRLAFSYNTFTIISFQNLIGIGMFLPFWLFMEARDFITIPFHARAFGAILLLAVFASSLAFMLFAFSVRHLGINRSNIYINLIPVFVAFFAFLILGDRFTVQKITGIAVVIAGLFLAQLRMK